MEENKPIQNEGKKCPPSTNDSPQKDPQLNNPSTEEAIVPAPETSDLPVGEAGIVNPTKKIKDMEVHHHSHESHGKKNWKSYFWEFLMLFLAVFCGFLAEYQLEHKIERDREKQFIQTMVEDLKSDTAQLSRMIASRKKRILELDTMFHMIASNEYLINGEKIYGLYGMPYRDILRFFPSDRTIQQLKNGGNLRLIRKKTVSNALIKYDVWIRNRKEYEPLQTELAGQLNLHIEKLVDPTVLNEITSAFANKQLQSDTIVSRAGTDNIPVEIMIEPLSQADKKIILKYIYAVKTIYLALRNDNILERKLATETFNLIIKEYHLK